MWKTALFLITIVLATPGGRAVLGEYAHQAASLFSGDLSYSDPAMILLLLGAVGAVLLMCLRSPKKRDVYVVWRVIRAEVGDDAVSNRTH
jgi:hypothetical protein